MQAMYPLNHFPKMKLNILFISYMLTNSTKCKLTI